MIRAALLLAGALAPAAALARPQLAPVWSDGAVIQRDRPVVVEGTSMPGGAITAVLGSDTVRGRAGADGAFSLAFPARSASAEPIALTVEDSTGAATVSDIVVGDVWLCSGQSNMAFTVAAGLNGFNNIQASRDPLLRMLTAPLDTAAAPVREFGGPVDWKAASPETTGAFSGACYYMLKELRAALGVPMGAIHSSWGGSQIRAWLTREAGAVLYGAEQVALLDGFAQDPLAAATAFAPVYEAWWREASGGKEPWRDTSGIDWRPVPKIGPWTEWADTPLARNGVANVLLRRTITLTPQQAAAGGTLAIGVIDDLDATWVNGRAVGFTHGWGTERQYRVPAEFLRAGENEVLVIATNTWSTGGFNSTADKLAFTVSRGERIALGEGWRYAVATPPPIPPRAPWDANAGIGVMHNRMIAPIGRFAMAGAAWYQGESDVGIPGYRDRMRELFAGWRRQFGPGMRMLAVQLANYGPVAERPVASGWAETRDVQRLAVEDDANAALVTAIDIGERTDIHPANKVLLGERLGRAALGQAMPMPERAAAEASGVTVTFSGIEGGLHAWSGPGPLGVELCGETQDSCRFARAQIAGDTLRIADDGEPVTRVRYAWADSPVVNLYDARPMPVPGFELPVEP